MIMIDLVYTLGKGSTWNDNELRYSLRSVEKHLKNFRNIYIVGECPDWLIKQSKSEGAYVDGIIHVPVDDSGHASWNIANKLLHACALDELSQKFLFMNDDFFFLKDVDAPTYPYYYDRYISNHLRIYKVNWYNNYIQATNAELQENGLPTKYFDIHNPIIYDKDLFPEVINKFDFNKKLTVKSIYCNALNISGIQMTDCKVIGWKKEDDLKAMLVDRHIFSTGDQCLIDLPTRKSPTKELLYKLFPNKSKYEQ